MSCNILRGAEFADAIKEEVRAGIAELEYKPCLVVVRVGEDPASAVYVGNKIKACEEVGIVSEHLHYDEDVSGDQVLNAVKELNTRSDVDGILVQLPLPKHIDERIILEAIDPAKDVDGFHPVNVGRLSQGQDSLVPCTPAGVVEILKRSGTPIAGKHAVIVGRSNIVGKPMAMLLLQENATVTICHSRTADLRSITSQADILVAAIGRAGFIRSEHIRDGAVVIDVGINKLEDAQAASELFTEEDLPKRLAAIEKRGFTLAGDVSYKDAVAKASAFTPVPGGVGLLTVAMLMKNTLQAAVARRS